MCSQNIVDLVISNQIKSSLLSHTQLYTVQSSQHKPPVKWLQQHNIVYAILVEDTTSCPQWRRTSEPTVPSWTGSVMSQHRSAAECHYAPSAGSLSAGLKWTFECAVSFSVRGKKRSGLSGRHRLPVCLSLCLWQDVHLATLHRRGARPGCGAPRGNEGQTHYNWTDFYFFFFYHSWCLCFLGLSLWLLNSHMQCNKIWN